VIVILCLSELHLVLSSEPVFDDVELFSTNVYYYNTLQVS